MTDHEYGTHRKRLTATTGVIYNQMILDLLSQEKDVTDNKLVSMEYLERIRVLSTEELEYILWGHNNSIVSRRYDTLTVIEDELFERATLTETGE